MTVQRTVRSVTYDLPRSLGLTTVFGNPGSAEQPFLQEFPDDFTYVLALQKASVIAMADGFAQVTGRPALVNVHSSAGLGNAVGNLVAAYPDSSPLIVTSGQQHREPAIGPPWPAGSAAARSMSRPRRTWSASSRRTLPPTPPRSSWCPRGLRRQCCNAADACGGAHARTMGSLPC